MTDKEVMQMALDALEEFCENGAILRQEPVAWMKGYKAGYAQAQETDLAIPRKEWVGLTDEEMFDCLVQSDNEAKRLPFGFKWFAEAIEAKLKDKNT